MIFDTLELIGDWIAVIIIFAIIAYTILCGIGYLIYRRKHKDENI